MLLSGCNSDNFVLKVTSFGSKLIIQCLSHDNCLIMVSGRWLIRVVRADLPVYRQSEHDCILTWSVGGRELCKGPRFCSQDSVVMTLTSQRLLPPTPLPRRAEGSGQTTSHSITAGLLVK